MTSSACLCNPFAIACRISQLQLHTFLPEPTAPLHLLLDEALHVQVHKEGGLHRLLLNSRLCSQGSSFIKHTYTSLWLCEDCQVLLLSDLDGR